MAPFLLEVAQVRAASKLRPHDALISLDVQNAFSSVPWAYALNAVLQCVPRLAPFLAVQWKALQLLLWLQDSEGACWHALIIYGSLLQSGLDAHPGFCIVLCVVLERTQSNQRVAGTWTNATVWAYVDDM